MLFPIEWPEPFGLVMMEAMACGIPVVAFRAGSVPEVIDDGVTGFIVEDVPGAVAAVQRVAELDRRAVREVFERRFSVQRMADDYVRLYKSLILARGHRAAAAEGANRGLLQGSQPTMSNTVSNVITNAMAEVKDKARAADSADRAVGSGQPPSRELEQLERE